MKLKSDDGKPEDEARAHIRSLSLWSKNIDVEFSPNYSASHIESVILFALDQGD